MSIWICGTWMSVVADRIFYMDMAGFLFGPSIPSPRRRQSQVLINEVVIRSSERGGRRIWKLPTPVWFFFCCCYLNWLESMGKIQKLHDTGRGQQPSVTNMSAGLASIHWKRIFLFCLEWLIVLETMISMINGLCRISAISIAPPSFWWSFPGLISWAHAPSPSSWSR